jgi:hypothetical protein
MAGYCVGRALLFWIISDDYILKIVLERHEARAINPPAFRRMVAASLRKMADELD